jgi:hypothetical protein
MAVWESDIMKERRQSKRYKVNRLARIQARADARPCDCLLVDISDAGVRLHAEGAEVPDDFFVLISGAKDERRACRVVWRFGSEIGARFTDKVYGFSWRVAQAGAA